MSMNRNQLRAHIARICEKRETPNYFDRFEPDTVMSGGIEIHLEVIPVAKNRPTVVFMPGTNAYTLIYGEFLCALSDKDYNIVGFDPRGHGQSGGSRGSYTLPELLNDMRAAVLYAKNRFNDKVAVAGSSQGGITAFYYASACNDVRCAICHNAADLQDPDSVRLTRYPAIGRILKPFLMRLAKIAPELKIPMSAYLDLAAEPVRNMGNAKSLIQSDPLLVPYIRLKTMASLGSEPLAIPVEEITTPIQILHAGKDNIFPQDYIEKLYRRMTCRKELKIYPGLPHYIIVDHIDKILPDIIRWLELNGA